MPFRRFVIACSFLIVPVLFAQSVPERTSAPPRLTTNADGTGTANKIPMWLDFDTLTDSVISQQGTFIGIGTSSTLNRTLTVNPGGADGGMRVFRDSLSTHPYLDILLNTASTSYGYLQSGDDNGWRSLVLNPYGGNVGIGTPPASSPTAKLHIYGTATADAAMTFGVDAAAGPAFNIGYAGGSYARSAAFMNVRPDASAVAPNPSIRFATADVQRMILTNAGRVGIGTLAPSAALEVVSQDYGVALRAVDPAAMAQGFGAGVALVGTYNTSGGSTPFATLRGIKLNTTDGNKAGKLVLQAHDSAGNPTDVALFSTGSMTFYGNATFTGNVVAAGSITGATVVGSIYQDVAEWVPATTDMAPGTVVVVNPERSNEVMPSEEEYDTRVAGVVSAQPGILLGVASASKEQIATTGRVKVKVDATHGPIAIGDLLVTSATSGVAMKSEPMEIQGRKFHQPGTIIGKALEALPSGTGEILVLLSLQ